MSESVRLFGTLEGVHQFNAYGSGTTGQVLGLFTFDLPASQYEQSWLRVGIGLDGQIDPGRASLMLNATTAGQDPPIGSAPPTESRSSAASADFVRLPRTGEAEEYPLKEL